jgi:hypothetical protein
MVNGGDVKELMNGGTTIVPNLDSIEEFRILTNNFDAEYGSYTGESSMSLRSREPTTFIGSMFEFLRNTALDARNFLCRTRSVPSEPVRRHHRRSAIRQKLFYFGDYQGTRNTESVDTD